MKYILSAILFLSLTGCYDNSVTPPVTPPVTPDVFIDKTVLYENLPELPIDVEHYAHETTLSYNGSSSKCDESIVSCVPEPDQGSTKKADLIKWYNEIRHADSSDNFKNFNGLDSVYREAPNFNEGQYNIGILSKNYLENHLDFYNFMRSLFGASRVYISGYKQVAAQASSFSDLGGGHYPGNTANYPDTLFKAIVHGRGAGNLQGGSVDKNIDYASLETLPRNGSLVSIWNESAGDGFAGMGHRKTFMYLPGKDLGVGLVVGFHTWLSWGEDPKGNDGNTLGGDNESSILNSYPNPLYPLGALVWPSHGYFPHIMLGGNNENWGMAVGSGNVSRLTSGESVELKMDYFVHSEAIKPSLLTVPTHSITLTDIVGSGINAGGSGPDNDGPDFSVADAAHQYGGGYAFSTDSSNYMQMRIPSDWNKKIITELETDGSKEHTVRFTFTTNPDGGLKVLKPFYMNQTVGENLVLQTTFFSIKNKI